MSRVLITGGAGFIGAHLAKKILEKGCQVDIIDNFSRGVRDDELQALEKSGARLIDQDLLHSCETLDRDYSFLFHLAAIIGVANIAERPFQVLRDNVAMLVHMIEVAREQKNLKRFVFASTSEVYAGALENFNLPIPTPESTPLALTSLERPRTTYMLSKIYGEALCQQSGLPMTTIRPHNIYGPRMGLSHVVPELLQKAHSSGAGATLEVFSINHTRTFCFVDDAIEMIWRAAISKRTLGKTLNVGNQEPEVSIGSLAETILRVVGKDLSMVKQPATEGSPTRRCPDMTQTAALIGYRGEVDLEEGVRRTYEWYRQKIFEGEGVTAR
jgi:UDP-glucose 4-epimerase